MTRIDSHDGKGKRAFAAALLVIVMLALSISGPQFTATNSVSTHMDSTTTTKSQPSSGADPHALAITLEPYSNDDFIGLGAWQKAFTLDAVVGGSSFGYNSCALELKFLPLNYEIMQDGYFILRFCITARVDVATGDNGYGGSSPAYRYHLPIWCPPGVINYVRTRSILDPILPDGTTGQYSGNHADIISAGSNTLRGHYTELDWSQLSDPYYWTWVTTGSYQTDDDFSTWAADLRAHQIAEDQIGQIQGCVDGITTLISDVTGNIEGTPEWFGYLLDGIAGAVDYLLGTTIPPAPDVNSHEGGTFLPDSLQATWQYGTIYQQDYVAQSNNWLMIAYEGYFKDHNGAPLNQLTLRLPVFASVVGLDGLGGGDTLYTTLNVTLTQNAWIFQDSSNPEPVNGLSGTGFSNGTARLNWSCDYYSSDDDWVKCYKIDDGVNPTLFLTNTLNGEEGPFQNNGVNIQQGAGVTRTYTIYTIDAFGKVSAGTSVTVTTPPPPTVTITSPTSGDTYYCYKRGYVWYPATVPVYMFASEPSYTSVRVRCGTTPSGGTWYQAYLDPITGQYMVTLYLTTGASPTKYYLQAEAQDAQGNTITSSQIYIWIQRSSGPGPL